jgi:ribosomal protein L11 methylase PrmA
LVAGMSKEAFFKKRWFVLSGLFIKDAEEIERQLNRKSIKTYQRLQEKNWLTLVGLK